MQNKDNQNIVFRHASSIDVSENSMQQDIQRTLFGIQ